MIKIRDLEYLVAIREHKHFGKASEACFVSQPTLSGQIKKLEDQLDLLLIERNRQNVMLTPAGEVLVKKAQSVLMAADDFQSTAKALTDPLSGSLSIGLIPTLAPYLLPHIMEGITSGLPEIDLFLYENKTEVLVSKLHQGELDILILPWCEGMGVVKRYDLFHEHLLLALPKNHELCNQKELKLEDLKTYKILSLEEGNCLREHSLDYCLRVGAEEDKRFSASSLETLRYMVAAGLGITLLPELAVSADQRESELITYRRFVNPAPFREIVLLTRDTFSRQA